MKKQQLNLYIKIKPQSTGETKKLVKVIKIIEVAGNQCFFYKQDYFALVHLKTGLTIFPSFQNSFKKARNEIMKRVNDNIESIEIAFINRAGDFEIIN